MQDQDQVPFGVATCGPVGRRWRAKIASETASEATSETAFPWQIMIPFFCFSQCYLGLDWPWWAQVVIMVALIYLLGIALVLRARYLGRSSPSGAGG